MKLFQITGTFEAEDIDDAIRYLASHLANALHSDAEAFAILNSERVIELEIRPVNMEPAELEDVSE